MSLPTTDRAAGWQEDVLGQEYEALTLPLPGDDEGAVIATLVRRRTSIRSVFDTAASHLHEQPLAGTDVLYVHGWSDYFFQQEMAERFEAMGTRFHALDLRKYGRSLLPHQTPGYVDDLAVYDADIEAALTAIGHDEADRTGNRRRLVLVGHSTGGLVLSLWATRHPGRAAAIVLNSPWLEFQWTAVGRRLMTPLVRLGARRNPLSPMPGLDPGFSTRTVSSSAEGSWTYDQRWRPERGFALHPGWLAAVFRGQQRVERGLGIRAPMLVLLSTQSLLQPRWNEDMTHADVALNVDTVAHRSLSLGNTVTISRIRGALHDVFLSAPTAREDAYSAVHRWARSIRD